MDTYTVCFFGHREIDNPLEVEEQLYDIVLHLLESKEYVEFLVGRNGEFDQLVSSTVRRVKRNYRDDNSALMLVLPYLTAEYENNHQSFHTNIMMRLKSARTLLEVIIKRQFR